MIRKYVFILVVLGLFSVKASGQVCIGKLVNGEPQFRKNPDELLENYNAFIAEYADMKVHFTSVSFVRSQDSAISYDYNLVFIGSGFRGSMGVQLEGDELMAVDKTTCITAECASSMFECAPAHGQSCTPCTNDGDCIKIASTESMLR